LLTGDPGHTLKVTYNAEEFRAAAQEGDYDVIMATTEEARLVKDDAATLLPNTAFLVLSYLPTRSALNEEKREFGKDNVLKVPTTTVAFLSAIEKARRSVR